jgi:cobalamin synthase
MAGIAYLMNTLVIKRFANCLGFMNGDLFGWSICLLELLYLILYVLLFVRM